jgi:hypothetical protein
MENPKNFYETERGKIIHYGIHEHNSGISILTASLEILKDKIEKNHQISKDDLIQYIGYLEKGKKRCTDAIDYIYQEIKAKEDLG